MEYLEVLDMTKLFTRELLLYSFFDIRFKKPLRVVLFLYAIINLLIWALPLYLIFFKNHINPYSAAFMLIPPIAMANLMSKPIWNNKSFPSWLSCQIKFMFAPKKYYDNRAMVFPKVLRFNNNFTVSRSRDFYKLFLIQKELHEQGKPKKKKLFGRNK